MHIPFAPRELLFSFFKQLAVPTGGWQKKKLAEGGYMYVFFFVFFTVSPGAKAQWGKIKEIRFCG